MFKHENERQHFTLHELTKGVYACIHKPGGGAFSNAGIVDLGDQILVVDAFDSLAAGRELRQTAENLFGRPVDWLLLTHSHSDHWIGAAAFDESTSFIAQKITRKVSKIWGAGLVKEYKRPSDWRKRIEKLETQLLAEQDARVCAGLEKSISRMCYTLAEMAEFQPRYPDRSFEETITFQGSRRTVEFRSLGRGHSGDDAVLLLPQDQIAFIGDIGFFNRQPFLGFCDINRHREQLYFFLNSDYQVLVPGHGSIGNPHKDIALQLDYLAVMEHLVGEVVARGGSLKAAKSIRLPEPFNQWLTGGMNTFETNVRIFYKVLVGRHKEG